MKFYALVIGFIIFDVISGLLKAAYNKDFNSTIMRQGGYHKTSELLVLLGAALFEYANKEAGLNINIPTVSIVGTYICLTETVSILENLTEVNPTLNKLLKPYLQKLQGTVKEDTDQ